MKGTPLELVRSLPPIRDVYSDCNDAKETHCVVKLAIARGTTAHAGIHFLGARDALHAPRVRALHRVCFGNEAVGTIVFAEGRHVLHTVARRRLGGCRRRPKATRLAVRLPPEGQRPRHGQTPIFSSTSVCELETAREEELAKHVSLLHNGQHCPNPTAPLVGGRMLCAVHKGHIVRGVGNGTLN